MIVLDKNKLHSTRPSGSKNTYLPKRLIKMGFFGSLFGKPLIIQHEYFGKMRYMKSLGYFETQVFFKPLYKMVECFVLGNSDGPFLNQVSFVEAIQDNYAQVCVEVVKQLGPLFQGNHIVSIQNFNVEFELRALRIISMPEGESTQWEISYDYIQDFSHIFTIMFEDWQAIGEQIDG